VTVTQFTAYDGLIDLSPDTVTGTNPVVGQGGTGTYAISDVDYTLTFDADGAGATYVYSGSFNDYKTCP